MRTRLGWTISYKSLYFVHLSLELVHLFTGMLDRSIVEYMKKNLDITRPSYSEQNLVHPLVLRYI